MKLVLDFGNTLHKAALYEGTKMIRLESFKALTLNKLKKFVGVNPIEVVILSSVINHPKAIEQYLKAHYKFIKLSSKTPVPVKNQYKSPETLGNDRLAAAVGATHLFPKHNILVINLGTCITYDLVNNKNIYLGGAISPGVNIRFKALHTFTDMLPLVSTKTYNAQLIGKSTKESILSGVLNGIYTELVGTIERYKKSYKGLKIIISGGDAFYFDKRIKSGIFAAPNIVLQGLNEILDYNAKK